MSANIKASVDGTQAIIGVGGVDQMTVSNAGVVTANSFVGLNSSSVTATGSTTARTLANRFADMVNVKDFGAVGDGIADDTAAIQAANNFANSLNSQLFFPNGIYMSGKLTSSCAWFGNSNDYTIIRRTQDCPVGSFITAVNNNFNISKITIDGNKTINNNGCNLINIPLGVDNVSIDRCKIINAKLNAGWGEGIFISSGNSSKEISLTGNYIFNNDAGGCTIEYATNCIISNNIFTSNGYSGLSINNYDITLIKKIKNIVIDSNLFVSNGRNGCAIANYNQTNDLIIPDYGSGNIEAQYVSVTNNCSLSNAQYGFVCSGFGICLSDNVVTLNNSSSPQTLAGILLTAYIFNVSNNIIISNLGAGIDAGGCNEGIISNNTISRNGTCAINLEASVKTLVLGNSFLENGPPSTGKEIVVDRYGAATATTGFTATTNNINIDSNTFQLNGGRYGIYVYNNPSFVNCIDNKFIFETNRERCIIHIASTGRISGNKILNSNYIYTTDVSGKLVVPDAEESIIINNATTVDSLQTASTDIVGNGVAWCSITNGGSSYTSQPNVNFIGGTGSGAAAYAIISASGVVTGIRMTSFGSYTVSPTSVTITGGGGSGATATLQWKLPLIAQKKLIIYHNTGGTITRVGAIEVGNPSNANIVMPAGGVIELNGIFNKWWLYGKNF